MSLIYLSLGSNIDAAKNIHSALDNLEQHFGICLISSVYESKSLGFHGKNFLNLVVTIESNLPINELLNVLKKFEDLLKRDRSAPKFSNRTIDIDILCVDDLSGNFDGIHLPRAEILKNAFVLLPLAEIAPDCKHPCTGLTYSDHWQMFNMGFQSLWKVDFLWRGEQISFRQYT
ncbi:MAG: 2-amino-4-hydroxy-6-hydroxymethyldihydropteridine diphosphokinase [Porticoccaceae bacterium]|nr:2-amino-4-hydroxy-6-hydroxymethyldihydropteridine diphosphokinase [Porticoccaceae bacterium]